MLEICACISKGTLFKIKPQLVAAEKCEKTASCLKRLSLVNPGRLLVGMTMVIWPNQCIKSHKQEERQLVLP